MWVSVVSHNLLLSLCSFCLKGEGVDSNSPAVIDYTPYLKFTQRYVSPDVPSLPRAISGVLPSDWTATVWVEDDRVRHQSFIVCLTRLWTTSEIDLNCNVRGVEKWFMCNFCWIFTWISFTTSVLCVLGLSLSSLLPRLQCHWQHRDEQSILAGGHCWMALKGQPSKLKLSNFDPNLQKNTEEVTRRLQCYAMMLSLEGHLILIIVCWRARSRLVRPQQHQYDTRVHGTFQWESLPSLE